MSCTWRGAISSRVTSSAARASACAQPKMTSRARTVKPSRHWTRFKKPLRSGNLMAVAIRIDAARTIPTRSRLQPVQARWPDLLTRTALMPGRVLATRSQQGLESSAQSGALTPPACAVRGVRAATHTRRRRATPVRLRARRARPGIPSRHSLTRTASRCRGAPRPRRSIRGSSQALPAAFERRARRAPTPSSIATTT